MGVAKYFDIVKEYVEILSETRELNLYYSVRYNLNLLIKDKLNEDKNNV